MRLGKRLDGFRFDGLFSLPGLTFSPFLFKLLHALLDQFRLGINRGKPPLAL
ncbi:MAG: hypothetical protein RIS11_1134, partial [Pseudomonadota bacterium]